MIETKLEQSIEERLPGRLISADSHVVQRGDLWSTRLPGERADRGPRAVRDSSDYPHGAGAWHDSIGASEVALDMDSPT